MKLKSKLLILNCMHSFVNAKYIYLCLRGFSKTLCEFNNCLVSGVMEKKKIRAIYSKQQNMKRR